MKALKKAKGFTLVEILVVITIFGAILTFGYQLLRTFMSERLTISGNLTLEALFKVSRENAMGNGNILSLRINTEKESMGLMTFNPQIEVGSDPALMLLNELQTQRRGSVEDKDDKNDQQSIRIDWIIKPQGFPIGIKKFYSPSGMQLVGPEIYVHFYPDGTSDSIIFQLKRAEKAFLFLPRYNVPARYFSNLPIDNTFIENENAVPTKIP